MGVIADELELPRLDVVITGVEEMQEAVRDAAERGEWLSRGEFGYVVTHYADVVAVLRDKRWQSAAGMIMEMSGIADPEFLSRQRTSILSAEGDEHTRLRRLVGPAFSPRNADRLRPFMRTVVDELVDAIAATGRSEVVGDICDPYPIPIICELLGAPRDDWRLFSRWAGDVLRIFDNNLAEDLPVITAAQDELEAYVHDLIARRRSEPGDDLLTQLIAVEEEGDKLSSDELVSLAEAVLVGGTDTTRNQLGLAVALLARHPEQWKLLGEQPALAPRAVEEVMRCFGAVRETARVASEDIEYRGVVFPKGTFISTAMAVANFDGAVFTDPRAFDITREPSGQPQLTFGSGIHYCLGAALARAELQEALPILARRLPELELDGEVGWKPLNAGIWGPQHLPVRFTPT
jgi:cytochrome P450